MPQFIADLEIHSRYSRAVSKEMTLENLALWAAKKGLQVLGTGDFTHPLWFKELKEKLEPAEPGLFQLRPRFRPKNNHFSTEKIRFLLSSEVNCVYSKKNKVRRVHHLIYAPSFEAVEKINIQLSWIGNLKVDGRPTLALDSKELLKILLTASPDSVLIPAHVWTPWFGIFGSKSGFDSLEECFEELTKEIFAIETGLSSDPPMNWRIPFLDDKAIISSSDAHSLNRIGREATIFDTEISYFGIMKALRKKDETFVGTIEFFPEEGKYHYDGHAACEVSFSPEESKKANYLCPKCGQELTIGVMSRIEELADPHRPPGFKPAWAKKFYSLIPLNEIIAEAFGLNVETKKVLEEYHKAINIFGSEFKVLIEASEKDLRVNLPPLVAEGIMRMRQNKVHIKPGYDGQYGVIKIFEEEEKKVLSHQNTLF